MPAPAATEPAGLVEDPSRAGVSTETVAAASAAGVVEEVTQTSAATEPAGLVEEPTRAAEVAETGSASPTAPVVDLGVSRQRARAEQTIVHVDRLRELIELEGVKARRRGPAGQRRLRELEGDLRRDVVEYYHQVQEQGGTLRQAAEELQLLPRTLRRWEQACRPQAPAVLLLGRPAERSELAARQAVLDFLGQHGAGVGVPRLREQFPDMARAELADMLGRYRGVFHDRYHTCARVLHWTMPGRVWAMDFAEPSLLGAGRVLPPIAGCFPYLLAVRDLASGYQLAWQPVERMTAATVVAELKRLFGQHGAPLVLKMDNGSAFVAAVVQEYLQRAGVFSLYSPPGWPGYNGAIEAAIGSLKTRTAAAAPAHGRLGCWTSADVSDACWQANTTARRRRAGRTAIADWEARSAVTAVERVRFELAVYAERMAARTEYGLTQEEELDHWQGARVDRKAIERALVGHDYLLFKGRRIPLTIQPGKVTYFV